MAAEVVQDVLVYNTKKETMQLRGVLKRRYLNFKILSVVI